MDWRRSPTTEKFSRSRSPYRIGLGSVFSAPCVAGLGAWRGTLLSGAGGAFERGWLSLGFWVAGMKLWVSWVAMLWFWVAVSQGLVDSRGFASEKVGATNADSSDGSAGGKHEEAWFLLIWVEDLLANPVFKTSWSSQVFIHSWFSVFHPRFDLADYLIWLGFIHGWVTIMAGSQSWLGLFMACHSVYNMLYTGLANVNGLDDYGCSNTIAADVCGSSAVLYEIWPPLVLMLLLCEYAAGFCVDLWNGCCGDCSLASIGFAAVFMWNLPLFIWCCFYVMWSFVFNWF
ncbi:hypothetical protein U1Q18_024207 [Sarracenia purpurea var. burkii]